jgi:hypothetical protein
MADNFLVAAHRHFEDAELLRRETRLDNAGHHYGVAGECAVKAVCIEETGDRPIKHFDPVAGRDLRGAAVVNLSGHKGQRVLAVLPQLFGGWSVHDRYSDTGHVASGQVDQWRADAQRVLQLMQGL